MLRGLQSEILNYSWETDAEAIQSLTDTRSKADVFILAGPYGKEEDIVRVIKVPANGKTVVVMWNPPKKQEIKKSDAHKISTAETLQKLLPNSKVVTAFSTNSVANFKQPACDGRQVDSFIAGDDATAVRIVDRLVRTVGFNPVILNGLSDSSKLEAL